MYTTAGARWHRMLGTAIAISVLLLLMMALLASPAAAATPELGTVVATGNNGNQQLNVSGWTAIVHVSAGAYHTVAVDIGGNALATGLNDHGQCNVSGWAHIKQVAAGLQHTVGLKTDGTAVAVGYNSYGQSNVSSWFDIVQVAAGSSHSVGLRSTGTVVAVGNNGSGRCDVSGWTNIVQVAAGDFHTVGLRSNGTVVAVGTNLFGTSDVSGWTNIVYIAATQYGTVGVREDGTVVATGRNTEGQCDVSEWTNIRQVAAGPTHTLGLRSDGRVVATGTKESGECDVAGWTNIAQVTAGVFSSLGLVYPAPRVTSVSPSSGSVAGGKTVTITGANLKGVKEIRFGGAKATGLVSISTSQWNCTTPAHAAGTCQVTVVTPGGTSTTAGTGNDFTYVYRPAVTALSNNAGPTSGRSLVTITGTSLNRATRVRFGETNATDVTVVSSTRITCRAPAHEVGRVEVTVTTPGGTSSTAGTGNDFTYLLPTHCDQTLSSIQKTGTWTHPARPEAYNGSYGRSSSWGASATVYFTGARIDYYAMKASTSGIVDIYLDNVLKATISLAASTPTYRVNIWSSGAIVNGNHTLRIVRNNGSASGKYLTLDYVDIWGTIRTGP